MTRWLLLHLSCIAPLLLQMKDYTYIESKMEEIFGLLVKIHQRLWNNSTLLLSFYRCPSFVQKARTSKKIHFWEWAKIWNKVKIVHFYISFLNIHHAKLCGNTVVTNIFEWKCGRKKVLWNICLWLAYESSHYLRALISQLFWMMSYIVSLIK